MKIIDFIKNNKVPTIAASVVLVAAVALGVTFGVMKHKDNVEVKPSEVETSSAESSSEASSVVEDSSSEVTSSEESASSVVSEAETVSTPSKTETVSSQAPVSSAAQTSSKSVSSASSNVVSSKPVSSTSNTTSSKPATSTPANSGGNTGTNTKWVCPDPAAHGSRDGTFCRSAQEHQENIAEYNRLMEEAKNQKPLVYPPGYDSMTWCTDCEKPFGDGHNGTCYLHWEGDTIVHGNYD